MFFGLKIPFAQPYASRGAAVTLRFLNVAAAKPIPGLALSEPGAWNESGPDGSR